MIKRIFVASCVLILSFGLYLPQLVVSSSMGTLGQSPKPYNPEFTQLVDGQNVEHVRKGPEGLVGNDGDTDRALWGYQKGGFEDGDDFGFKISKKGVRVQDATDRDLIMSSAFTMLKVLKSGVASFVVPTTGPNAGSSEVQTIPHGLGYPPMVLGSVPIPRDDAVVGTFWRPLPYDDSNTAAGTAAEILVDATNIYIIVGTQPNGAWASSPLEIRYYILDQTAN